jgi:hypothetical protein
MSTMEYLVTGWSAARAEARRRRGLRSGTRTRSRATGAVIEHGLAVLALGSFVGAALMVAVPLGLAVAGVAFFVLELRVSSE